MHQVLRIPTVLSATLVIIQIPALVTAPHAALAGWAGSQALLGILGRGSVGTLGLSSQVIPVVLVWVPLGRVTSSLQLVVGVGQSCG